MVAMVTPYLVGKTYYIRKGIPKELRSHFGMTEFKLSLKTKDLAKAKQLTRIKDAEWSELIARAKGGQLDLNGQEYRVYDDTARVYSEYMGEGF